MSTKASLEPEEKTELLIQLAFGISIEELMIKYNLTKPKIINLRKNNYKMYNEYFNHWRIDKDIAVLGLPPKFERAVNVIKKFYKKNVEINEEEECIIVKGKKYHFTNTVDLADEILRKDGITAFKDWPIYIKNNY